METSQNIFNTIKDKTVNAVDYVTDLVKNTGYTVGNATSSTFESGVSNFKGTSLGDTFFKNIPAIFITVIILIGGIMYIDFVKTNYDAEGPKTIQKTVTLEPNTQLNGRYIPNDEGWTEPIITMQRELTEGFGSEYSEKELESIHTKCSDDFCVLHNKSPKDLENACNSINDQNICATKCCCGWTKYMGYAAENDAISITNKASATISNNGQKDGKCVAGNSKSPLNNYDINNKPRDLEYYYYMNKCVNGTACTSI